MEISYVEIVSNAKQNRFIYEFEGEKVIATLVSIDGESTDVFDFSGMPDGVLDEIETHLDVCPVITARRDNGVLHLELIKFKRCEIYGGN